MRLFVIPAFAILFSFACNSADEEKKEVTGNTPAAVSTSNFKTLDTAVSFSGFWVNEQYVETVKKNKSPLKTEVPEISCISIPDKTLKVTRFIYGFHEGGGDLVFVKNSGQYEIWDTAVQQKIKDVGIIRGDKIKIGNDYFVKLQYVEAADVDYGPTILEEILFKGTYKAESGATVEFRGNGTVKGLDSFSNYQVLIDYADQGMQVDQVLLGKNRVNNTNYGFKFNNDMLVIYTLKCLEFDSTNNVCAVVDFDRPVYKLIKQ